MNISAAREFVRYGCTRRIRLYTATRCIRSCPVEGKSPNSLNTDLSQCKLGTSFTRTSPALEHQYMYSSGYCRCTSQRWVPIVLVSERNAVYNGVYSKLLMRFDFSLHDPKFGTWVPLNQVPNLGSSPRKVQNQKRIFLGTTVFP